MNIKSTNVETNQKIMQNKKNIAHMGETNDILHTKTKNKNNAHSMG